MQDSRYIIGVDVSKSKLDYYVTDSLRGTVANTQEGISRLLDEIITRHPGIPHVCLEHTGIYGRPLAEGCHGRGVVYSLLDPKKIYHYKKGKYGTRAKTDRHDAQLIRNYAADNPPQPSAPPTQRQEELRELDNLRALLVKQCAELKTALRHARVKPVIAHYQRRIARLEKDIAGFEQRIAAMLDEDKATAVLRQRFLEVQGVGPATANAVLIHLRDAIGNVSDKRIANLAGLAPIPDESGNISLPWRIEGGRKRVRDTLYMAARSASRHNPVLMPVYRRLRAKNKRSRCATIAVARNLVCLLNRIARDPDFKPVTTRKEAPLLLPPHPSLPPPCVV